MTAAASLTAAAEDGRGLADRNAATAAAKSTRNCMLDIWSFPAGRLRADRTVGR
jgi:hypothetical protein